MMEFRNFLNFTEIPVLYTVKIMLVLLNDCLQIIFPH